MAVKTTLEQLEEVQTAITALVGGAQSWRMGDTNFTRANLADLQKREDVLLARYQREQRGGSITRIDLGHGSGT